MSDTPRPAGVTPPVAVVFAGATFVALAIGGLGVASLLLNADVIPVTGLGPIPGVVGLVLATAAFAGILLWALRADPPAYLTAVPCALGAFVAELAGIVMGTLLSDGDPARGVAAAGTVALGWPGMIVLGSGLLAALLGVFLVRVRTDRPRWTWEDDDAP